MTSTTGSKPPKIMRLPSKGMGGLPGRGQILEQQGVASPPDSLTKFLHATEPARRLA